MLKWPDKKRVMRVPSMTHNSIDSLVLNGRIPMIPHYNRDTNQEEALTNKDP
jgi:hypothetical protein